MDANKIDERMKAFRLIQLPGKGKTGDLFLQPWVYCHVFALGSRSKGERRRATRELGRFFNQKELVAILKDAGEKGETLLEEQLMDSAQKYLEICRDDDGFGRKLFGLVKLKPEAKEDKIIGDVYGAMLPLLAALPDLAEADAMIRALDRACRQFYPLRLETMEAVVASLKDDGLRERLPSFSQANQEAGGSPPER